MIRIRLAQEEDIPDLQKVKPILSAEQARERIKRQSVGEVEFLVLEKDNGIVSFVLLKWRGKKTHPKYPDMEDLYTRESERLRGYGSVLIAECEKRAGKKGFTKIGLAVNSELNDPARKLYEKLGYLHDGGRSYVDAVYDGVEDWCIDMEKDLK